MKLDLTLIDGFDMKYILLVILAFSIGNTASAQIKKNSLYLEAGGNTIYYSINYDRIIPLTPRLKLAPRVGFMYLPMSSIYNYTSFEDISIPLEANLLWSKNEASRHHVEGGLGLNLFQIQDGVNSAGENKTLFRKITTIRFGYRNQKADGGLMYRAGLLVPITRDNFSNLDGSDDLFYTFWAGFSIGYSF